ncbi:hypothetical protein B0H13DRAFT_2305142 [Mycena leptocephala]|nr:hypothetical protein B0H13DRAFT_2305142 [Mycena leptocephala]
MRQYIRDKALPNEWETIDLGKIGSNDPGTGRPAMVSAVDFMRSEGDEETLSGTPAESATDSIASATA